jgi:exodeoxyribonuclease VII small subunit
MTAKGKKTEKSFEENFSRLEKILEKLESEDVTLEETIKLYEEGLTLTKFCYDKLNNAELRIKEINKTLKGVPEIKDYK